jgi:hypothetical protein
LRQERRFGDALWFVAVSGIGRAFSDASPNSQTILERHLSVGSTGLSALGIGGGCSDIVVDELGIGPSPTFLSPGATREVDCPVRAVG